MDKYRLGFHLARGFALPWHLAKRHQEDLLAIVDTDAVALEIADAHADAIDYSQPGTDPVSVANCDALSIAVNFTIGDKHPNADADVDAHTHAVADADPEWDDDVDGDRDSNRLPAFVCHR